MTSRRARAPRRVPSRTLGQALCLAALLFVAACSDGTVEPKSTSLGATDRGSPQGETTVEPPTDEQTSGTGAAEDEDGNEQPSDRFVPTPVEWQPCGGGICADLDVPLDHADPTGPTISIALAGVPATGAADQRLGTIFVNFGGPGGEGTETILSFAPFIPAELRERFDVVSWDPRGVESSAGLGCDDLIGDEPTELVDANDGFTDEVANDRPVWDTVMACVARSPIVDELGTRAVANDLDIMREAVGDEALSYLGFSYGTQIGWVYATLFPGNVRAMVLDGAAPPFASLAESTLDQIATIEAAIDRYDVGCAQAGCPLAAEGFRATILRLMRELEAEPIPLPDGTTFGPVDLGDLVVTMTYLDPEEGGPALSRAVADLDLGQVGPVNQLRTAFQGGFEEALFWSVLCADGAMIPVDELADVYRRAFDAGPLVGLLPGGIFCDSYPGEVDGLPELDTIGTPTLLVIGNTGDNATPYADAVRLDELLANSELLTYDGSGHTITFFDDCIDGHVVDYFVDGTVPPTGTRCGNPSTVGDGWFVPVDR